MPTITPMPLPEFRARIAKYYGAAGKAPKTIQQLDHALRLVERAGAETTASLTTMTVAEVILARGPEANANTTRGLLGRLRRCVRLAIRDRLLDREDEPDWATLRPRETEPVRNRPHPEAEIARLLDHLESKREDWYGGRLFALASLVAHTGLRRNEALFARVEDLDLGRGFIFCTSRPGAGRLKTARSAAPVPLAKGLVESLREWLPRCGGEWLFPGARREGPWSGGSPGYRPIDRLRQAGNQVGIAMLGFHSLRHSLATHLLVRGVPEWAIQRILRHTTPLTTKRYLHPTDIEVAALVSDFRYRAGPTASNPAAREEAA